MLAEKIGVGRQTRVAEATPPRSSRSRRDKPQGLAPFPATGRGEVCHIRYLWRGQVAGEWGLWRENRGLGNLFVRVDDELSACGRCVSGA